MEKFFYKTRQPSEGSAQQPPQKGGGVGQKLQRGAHQPPEGQGVDRRAQAEGDGVEDPHPAVAKGERVDEQGGSDGQPEQGVQQVLQPAPAQPVAEQAHHVIERSGPGAQQGRAAEERRLVHNVNFH